jgi:hypothetical protein
LWFDSPAWLVQDYELAATHYRAAAAEFKADKAWRCAPLTMRGSVSNFERRAMSGRLLKLLALAVRGVWLLPAGSPVSSLALTGSARVCRRLAAAHEATAVATFMAAGPRREVEAALDAAFTTYSRCASVKTPLRDVRDLTHEREAWVLLRLW